MESFWQWLTQARDYARYYGDSYNQRRSLNRHNESGLIPGPTPEPPPSAVPPRVAYPGQSVRPNVSRNDTTPTTGIPYNPDFWGMPEARPDTTAAYRDSVAAVEGIFGPPDTPRMDAPGGYGAQQPPRASAPSRTQPYPPADSTGRPIPGAPAPQDSLWGDGNRYGGELPPPPRGSGQFAMDTRIGINDWVAQEQAAMGFTDETTDGSQRQQSRSAPVVAQRRDGSQVPAGFFEVAGDPYAYRFTGFNEMEAFNRQTGRVTNRFNFNDVSNPFREAPEVQRARAQFISSRQPARVTPRPLADTSRPSAAGQPFTPFSPQSDMGAALTYDGRPGVEPMSRMTQEDIDWIEGSAPRRIRRPYARY